MEQVPSSPTHDQSVRGCDGAKAPSKFSCHWDARNFHTDSCKSPFFFPLAWVWYSEVLQIRYFSGSLLCVHSLKFKESWRHESPGSIDAWNYCLSISEKYILLLLNTGLWTFLFTGAAKFVSPKNNREMWKECDAECKPFPSQFIRRRGRTFHYPGQYLGAICLWVTAHMQAVDASSSTSSDTNH